MEKLKKICFTTFVFGTYQKYIPYYIYSVLNTYPDAFVKIFIDSSLQENVEKSLQEMIEHGFVNHEILFVNFDDLNFFSEYKIKGGGPKTLFRWLFKYDFFKEFEYLYYGDVDILVLPEKNPLLNLHMKQMDKFGVPFSNAVRRDDNGKLTKRLTGLHFVNVKPYFERVSPIIDDFLKDEKFRKFIMKDVTRDEELLYKINELAFEFNDVLLSRFIRPIHGVHLGAIRNVYGMNVKSEHLNINQLSISMEQLKMSMLRYNSDELFIKIKTHIYIQEIFKLNELLNIKNTLNWKIEHFYEYYFDKKKLKKRIKSYLK